MNGGTLLYMLFIINAPFPDFDDLETNFIVVEGLSLEQCVKMIGIMNHDKAQQFDFVIRPYLGGDE